MSNEASTSANRPTPTVRKAARLRVEAEVRLRRSGHQAFVLEVIDMSSTGCRVSFVERPALDEKVWLKFDGLEALPATVCWVRGFEAGLELERPIHEAVFNHLAARLAARLSK